MPTAPVLLVQAETSWVGGVVKTAPTFEAYAGDVLVAYVAGEYAYLQTGEPPENVTYTPSNTQGATITWTVCAPDTTALNATEAMLWSAVLTEDYPVLEVVFTRSTALGQNATFSWLAGVLVFRGSDGIGAAANTRATNSAPSLTIGTTGDESAVVVLNADFAIKDGASRVWRTGAGSLVELTYMFSSAESTVYLGYHPNAATAGSNTVGLTAPTQQDYTIGAVEVLSGELVDVNVGSLIVKRKR